MSGYLRLIALWVIFINKCKGSKYVDLSYDINEDSAYWPTGVPYSRKTVAKGYTPKGYWYESYRFCMGEHTSTHLDAPSHFAEGKWSTEQIPIDHLFGPGVVIDLKDKVSKNHTAELTTDDLMMWLNEYGPFPDGVIVFVRTGWGSRYGKRKEYFGTDTNDTSNLVFPGISNGAAQLLVGYEAANGRKVVGVGLDTPSLDHGPSKTFETHQTLFKANIYGLENVANLDKLPVTGFQVAVLPMKIREGSGAPVRIIATLGDTSDAPPSTFLGSPLLLSVLVILYSAFQHA